MPSPTDSNVPKSECLNVKIASHVVANIDSIIDSMTSLKTVILDKTISSRDLFLIVMGEQLQNFTKQNYITAFLGYASSCLRSMEDYQEILDQLFSNVKEVLSGVDLGEIREKVLSNQFKPAEQQQPTSLAYGKQSIPLGLSDLLEFLNDSYSQIKKIQVSQALEKSLELLGEDRKNQ